MLLQDLRDDARYHISPQLTAAEYPDVLLDKNINRWYQKILAWIIPDQGEWEINGDILTLDLEIDQTDYEIPVTFLRIFKAEIMYHNGGKFVPLTALSIQRNQNVAFGNSTVYGATELEPTVEVFGDFLQVFPAPKEQVVNGLKIWAQLSFADIDISLPLPDIAEPIQRILSYGPALDYCIAEEMWNKVAELKRIIYGDARMPDDKGLKGEMIAMYSTRTGNRRDRVVARRASFR